MGKHPTRLRIKNVENNLVIEDKKITVILVVNNIYLSNISC